MASLKITLCSVFCLVSGLSEPAPTVSPTESPEKLHVEAGDSILLSCQSQRPEEIAVLKWTRSNMTDFVFFYREKRQYQRFQNQLYQGRVQLVDPQMSSRNLSVILANTTLEDTGTYYCRAGLARRHSTETLHVIDLKVAPPSDPTDEPSEDGGTNLELMLGLPAAVVLVAGVGVGVAVLVVLRRRNQRGHRPGNPRSASSKTETEL
ncbi:butyrophilin subfamily 2 member A1-like [Anableps anableps]